MSKTLKICKMGFDTLKLNNTPINRLFNKKYISIDPPEPLFHT